MAFTKPIHTDAAMMPHGHTRMPEHDKGRVRGAGLGREGVLRGLGPPSLPRSGPRGGARAKAHQLHPLCASSSAASSWASSEGNA